MPAKILFQRDNLTITESHLIVGRARVTVFFPSISAVSIYDGRPLIGTSIIALVGLIPMSFLFILGARIFGPYFPTKAISLMVLPIVGLAVAGILYRVKCLFVTIDGHSVAVLKSKDLSVLEEAKTAIEEAKTSSESRSAH